MLPGSRNEEMTLSAPKYNSSQETLANKLYDSNFTYEVPVRTGKSTLNLAAARLRHIAGTNWSTKRYLNIQLLKDQQMRSAIL
jgi:hypothetical protein